VDDSLQQQRASTGGLARRKPRRGIDWFGKITIFDPSTGEKIAESQMLGSSSILHFLPDGKSLVTVMANGSVYRIDAGTGESSLWFTGLDKLAWPNLGWILQRG